MFVNPLIPTLESQSNGPLYSNAVIGRLAVDGWAVYLVQRGGAWAGPQRGGAFAGWGPAQSPPRCTKCNSPPTNGQLTNFILWSVLLVYWPLMGGLLHLVQRWGAWAGCGPAQSPPRCTHQLPVYQLHIIWCGNIIASGLQRVKSSPQRHVLLFVFVEWKAYLSGTGSLLAAAPAVSGRNAAGPVRPVLDILMALGTYCIGHLIHTSLFCKY